MQTEEQALAAVRERFGVLKEAIDSFFEARRALDHFAEECDDPLCGTNTLRADGVVHSLSTFVVLAEYATMIPDQPDATFTDTPMAMFGSPVAALGLVVDAQHEMTA